MKDWDWDMLRATTYLHTITFRYPKAFRKAVAKSLGRDGTLPSTQTEAEDFIREAVNANINDLMEEMFDPPPPRPKANPSKLKARKYRP